MQWISIALYCLMGGMGIYIEQASQQRLILLLGPFLAGLSLLCLPLVRANLPGHRSGQRLDHPVVKWLLYVGLTALAVAMETASKFSVNDFFNYLFFAILLSAFTQLSSKAFLWLLPVAAGGLLWKYAYVLTTDPGIFKPVATVANLALFGLVAVILHLSQRLMSEREALVKANGELLRLTQEIEGLTVYRERQYIAREIHDTVGHGLTALVMKLEMSKLLGRSPEAEQVEKAAELLEEAITDGRLALRNTRQVVEAMNSPRRAVSELRQLVARADQTGKWQIELKGEACFESLGDLETHGLYRAIQESLTNAFKYSNGNRIDIDFKCLPGATVLTIADNGRPLPAEKAKMLMAISGGSSHLNAQDPSQTGMGLSAMAERIKRLGGQIRFDFEQGTDLIITLKRDPNQEREA